MLSKKRKRGGGERRSIHPRNKYAENPPDFALLASLYPSFEPYVFYTRDGRPRIDWTDFNATRELTRVLLLHDHGLDWWIPDGQLCPTVPNRLNYIHWVEDLLATDIIPNTQNAGDTVKGFDIGTGANCIYPLLGASLLGWRFVGSDVTDVALEWAEKNVKNNQHISDLIEIRKVHREDEMRNEKESSNAESNDVESNFEDNVSGNDVGVQTFSSSVELSSKVVKSNHGSQVLLGVVKQEERFDFCMCNPPFFESIEEAGVNPKTACGGTLEEMVCSGGEQAFITRIIKDSVQLKQSFRWYTSMVGKKSNLKHLIAKLWDVKVTIVKSTEFVQGQTSRWGLAWSFLPPSRKIAPSHVTEKSNLSFTLEGIQRQYNAIHVLQSVDSFFCCAGASCKLDANSFYVDIIASKDQCDAILKAETQIENKTARLQSGLDAPSSSNHSETQLNDLHVHISVFQQIPGTLLVRGSLHRRHCALSGTFPLLFQKLEDSLKAKFCRKGTS